GALRAQAGDRDAVRGPVRRRELHGPPPAAGTVLRLPAPPRPGADALSGRLLAAGLGQRPAVHAAGSLPRPAIRSVQGRNPAVQSAAAGVPRRSDPARSPARVLERRSAGAAAERYGIAGSAPHQRRYPGFDRVFVPLTRRELLP